MTDIEKKLGDKLSEVNKIIDEQVKICKKYLESEDSNWIQFNIGSLDISKFIEYNNKGGIYYLQINFNDKLNYIDSESDIFKILNSEWIQDERKKIPKIIRKRIEQYKIEQFKANNWIPFYIGKSQGFENRMKEHFTKGSDCETYGLKLNCVNNAFFKGCSYRIKFMHMPHLTDNKYYWSVGKIESDLRNKLNPLCGK